MTIVEHIATAADLERLPDDGFRYELVCGEVRKMVPAGNEHGKIAALVTASLVQHVLANRLGSVYAAENGVPAGVEPGYGAGTGCGFRVPSAAGCSRRGSGLLAGSARFGGGGGLAGRSLRRGRGKGSRLAGGRDADGGRRRASAANGGGASNFGRCGCITRRRCVGGRGGGAGVGGVGRGVVRLVQLASKREESQCAPSSSAPAAAAGSTP